MGSWLAKKTSSRVNILRVLIKIIWFKNLLVWKGSNRQVDGLDQGTSTKIAKRPEINPPPG